MLRNPLILPNSRKIAFNKAAFMCFINLIQAFDRVKVIHIKDAKEPATEYCDNH